MSNRTQALRVTERVSCAADLAPVVVDMAQPQAPDGCAVVEVNAAGINPSDVKAAMGMMPYAIWPRTPGRDYAGKVVAGPEEWIGQDVWGTGGDLGITRDGTHARYLLLPVAALVRRPAHISAASAAMAGVPFVTAHEGLRRAGLAGAGQTVVVFGSNGKVGQAAIQLASRAGARVIGVERGGAAYLGHAAAEVRTIDGSRDGIAAQVMDMSGGVGADIAYNTVGSPYFAAALESLKVGGRQIVISTPDRNVPFDIQAFYRRDLQLIGVDSLKLDATRCAAVFRELLPGFEDRSLRSFPVGEAAIVPLSQARAAYLQVLEGAQDRPVLAP
ncbi:quinone oxidoreductase family protein [Achromobacter xylosoxidans]|uniref:quinone oxidoreductase family protein n=1 Tax=Alcaligenes xylosoxydans xylosoxydans TaxID=85698 RepID=UPI0022B92F53|nr:zinc-binding alcohol dehydrogenase family protein [Achromobacter xylosoxidans]MCZ8389557.1 zinc-binding alcohol dehydrogenase family protein [Achromobacter xylosoxidans]